MMWYLVEFKNNATSEEEKAISIETRQSVREAHLARCQALEAEDRLLVGGPFPKSDNTDPEVWKKTGGYSGGMIIVAFDSLKAATEWAENDPYVTSGVFGGAVIVRPWYQTVGKGVSFGRAW